MTAYRKRKPNSSRVKTRWEPIKPARIKPATIRLPPLDDARPTFIARYRTTRCQRCRAYFSPGADQIVALPDTGLEGGRLFVHISCPTGSSSRVKDSTLVPAAPRKTPNRSFDAQWEAVCARCFTLIAVGERARYAPDGGLVHHNHDALDRVLTICQTCWLAQPCDCHDDLLA